MEAEMKMALRDSVTRTRRQGGFVLVGILVALSALAGRHLLMMRRARVPPASEFGLGPRTSNAGLYMATLLPIEPLQKRKLQAVQVRRAVAFRSEGTLNARVIPN
jgi:hypothetical protein